MNVSVKIKSFTFVGKSVKEAYLKGCKKLALIMAPKEQNSISFKIERSDKDNSVTFSLYTNLDIGKEQKHFCTMCKELHSSFYINEEYNCSRCNMKSFLSGLRRKSNISKGFYFGKLDTLINIEREVIEIESFNEDEKF